MNKVISRQRRWQLKKKEAGLCVICGKCPIHKSERCLGCYTPYLARTRKYMRTKREESK